MRVEASPLQKWYISFDAQCSKEYLVEGIFGKSIKNPLNYLTVFEIV